MSFFDTKSDTTTMLVTALRITTLLTREHVSASSPAIQLASFLFTLTSKVIYK
jgi:hypothetical protein